MIPLTIAVLHVALSWDWTAIGTLLLALATIQATRHDNRERKAERERDDRLRTEASAALAVQELDDARQVLVKSKDEIYETDVKTNFNKLIIVSAPLAYVITGIKPYRVRQESHGGLSANLFENQKNHLDYSIKEDEQRRCWGYRYTKHNESEERGMAPMVEFLDFRKNRFFQYNNYTLRATQNADPSAVVNEIARLIGGGPRADD